MAKRRYSFDEEKISSFLKEGRGQGHGAEYLPWLTVQDVSSIGRATRIHGRKTGREHHLLSDIETAAFLLFDWSEAVTDIREQYPLDREETRRISAEMGVLHPFDTKGKCDLVMTTDLLVDVHTSNGLQLHVRSVKPAKELEDKRTLEKLEIDRRYWIGKCDSWGLITELDVPMQRVKNLRWLHEMFSLAGMEEAYPGYWSDRCNRFLQCLPNAKGGTIKRFIQQLESTQGFAAGEGLMVLRHLGATKQLLIDLDQPFTVNAPLAMLAIAVVPTGTHQTRGVA